MWLPHDPIAVNWPAPQDGCLDLLVIDEPSRPVIVVIAPAHQVDGRVHKQSANRLAVTDAVRRITGHCQPTTSICFTAASATMPPPTQQLNMYLARLAIGHPPFADEINAAIARHLRAQPFPALYNVLNHFTGATFAPDLSCPIFGKSGVLERIPVLVGRRLGILHGGVSFTIHDVDAVIAELPRIIRDKMASLADIFRNFYQNPSINTELAEALARNEDLFSLLGRLRGVGESRRAIALSASMPKCIANALRPDTVLRNQARFQLANIVNHVVRESGNPQLRDLIRAEMNAVVYVASSDHRMKHFENHLKNFSSAKPATCWALRTYGAAKSLKCPYNETEQCTLQIGLPDDYIITSHTSPVDIMLGRAARHGSRRRSAVARTESGLSARQVIVRSSLIDFLYFIQKTSSEPEAVDAYIQERVDPGSVTDTFLAEHLGWNGETLTEVSTYDTLETLLQELIDTAFPVEDI